MLQKKKLVSKDTLDQQVNLKNKTISVGKSTIERLACYKNIEIKRFHEPIANSSKFHRLAQKGS